MRVWYLVFGVVLGSFSPVQRLKIDPPVCALSRRAHRSPSFGVGRGSAAEKQYEALASWVDDVVPSPLKGLIIAHT